MASRGPACQGALQGSSRGRQDAAPRAICPICPHACALADGELGLCRARRAVGARVRDENYGRVTSAALDPIEKKPLARFHPGTTVLSIGSYGCNLSCPWCQNASIACAGEADVPWQERTPDMVVQAALDARPQGCIGIAYTYNEPFVGLEFVRDCAEAAHEAGLANVVVSNGMVNPRPLDEMLGLIDAANIDLKGWGQGFYDLVDGCFATVQATIEAMAACDTCHLEVTTLVVPGVNDDEASMEAMASWIASLDPAIPYHVTRCFPCHRMAAVAPTPVATVRRLADVARRHLEHVYVGNC